jgi:non-heme chloroperoxidase
VKPLVIAIHGAVANAATWIPLERALGDAIDLCAGDLPGHGLRRNEPFVFERAVDELSARVLDEAARRPVVLAGDSLGGYLSLAVAARAGAVLRGVVAGSCTFPMRGIATMLARLSLVADPLVPAGAIAALMRRSCAPDVAEAILARGLVPAMRGATLRALLGRDVLADVAAIPVPIVFIDGQFDIPIVNVALHFARRARSGSLIVVRRAAHGVGLTHPAAFAGAVKSLFRNDTAGGTE